jgi:hypothetical protein
VCHDGAAPAWSMRDVDARESRVPPRAQAAGMVRRGRRERIQLPMPARGLMACLLGAGRSQQVYNGPSLFEDGVSSPAAETLGRFVP